MLNLKFFLRKEIDITSLPSRQELDGNFYQNRCNFCHTLETLNCISNGQNDYLEEKLSVQSTEYIVRVITKKENYGHFLQPVKFFHSSEAIMKN